MLCFWVQMDLVLAVDRWGGRDKKGLKCFFSFRPTLAIMLWTHRMAIQNDFQLFDCRRKAEKICTTDVVEHSLLSLGGHAAPLSFVQQCSSSRKERSTIQREDFYLEPAKHGSYNVDLERQGRVQNTMMTRAQKQTHSWHLLRQIITWGGNPGLGPGLPCCGGWPGGWPGWCPGSPG